MRALLMGAALLAIAAAADAKDMAAGAECHVLGRTYGFEMRSLGRVEKREPFHAYENRNTFAHTLYWPFGIINAAQHHAYDSAGVAQYDRVAELLSCGLQKGCDWAKAPGADRSPSGRLIIRTECPG